ncbi:MAG: EamA family transporter [Eubacteriales bacterium]|nr:EamA family transporter [Eubacteriales bacterium]
MERGKLLIILAGCLWGCMGIFVRTLNGWGLGTFEIVALRAAVTAVLTGGILGIFKPKLLKIRLKDVWCFLGTGICSIVFFNYCYFKSIVMTSLPVAAVLLYTAPAMVVVMSALLFREKITPEKIFSLVLVFVGCVLVAGIVGNGAPLTPAGLLIGLGAGFGYALYSIFGRYALERGYHSLTILFYTFLFASLGVLPFADFGKVWDVMAMGAGQTAFSLAFGLFSTVVPYFVYNLGLTSVENGTASILASVEPAVASFIGIVIFGERVDLWQLAGMILVFASIVVCSGKKVRTVET